jgi:hypothetical protein
VSLFFEKSIYLIFPSPFGQNCSSGGMSSKRSKGSVGGGEAGKKAKTTPDAGGKSVSEKSQATRTSKNPFAKSPSQHTVYTYSTSYLAELTDYQPTVDKHLY